MTLLSLDVECPRCGTKPNLQAFTSFLELVQEADPDRQLGVWWCQGRVVASGRVGPVCGERIVIEAGMVQRATTVLTSDLGGG